MRGTSLQTAEYFAPMLRRTSGTPTYFSRSRSLTVSNESSVLLRYVRKLPSQSGCHPLACACRDKRIHNRHNVISEL